MCSSCRETRPGRRFGMVFLIAIISIFLVPPAGARAEALHLYCGAGLRQPVDILVADFQKETGLKVNVEYGGSGQLLTRAKATGLGDVFLSGSAFYVDKLAEAGQVTSVKPVVLHTPVVGVNIKRAGDIKTFADLAKPGVRIGLGDPKAMALGRTAEQILDKSGIKEAILKNVATRAATVKQLTLYVVQGDVDAGIIARADAFQNKDKLAVLDIDPSWYTPEVVTIAAMKSSPNPQAAQKLTDYLASGHAVEVFGRFGFLPAQ